MNEKGERKKNDTTIKSILAIRRQLIHHSEVKLDILDGSRTTQNAHHFKSMVKNQSQTPHSTEFRRATAKQCKWNCLVVAVIQNTERYRINNGLIQQQKVAVRVFQCSIREMHTS